MNIYAQLLIEEAQKRGINVEEIDHGFNIFHLTYQGETVRCWESLTDKTTAFTLTVCQNKFLTGKLLKRAGLNVAEHALWENEKQGLDFFHYSGQNIVVKPLNGEQGKGITVGVKSKEKLLQAVREAKKYDDKILLEKYVEGNDLRVIVINYQFVAAIERVPAIVETDGKSTVKQLIENKNILLAKITKGESQVPLNEDTSHLLKEQGYTLQDVLPAGKKISVCRQANFHAGGTIRDVTPEISSSLVEISELASKVLQVPVVGLDLLVPDFSGKEYIIIEANERPGLANHEPQPTAEKFIDFLFPQTKK